jgi:hypothetical protein
VGLQDSTRWQQPTLLNLASFFLTSAPYVVMAINADLSFSRRQTMAVIKIFNYA